MMRAKNFARSANPKRWMSATPVATGFNEVKFQKEEVADVMKELPAFNFYEMDPPSPFKYRHTLDKTILVEPPAPKATGQPSVEFAQLENGLRVAAIDNGGLLAQLALAVNGGSRHEVAGNFGASHMVSEVAFKSTAHLSHLRQVKTLEQLGADATTTCVAGREDVTYHCEVLREFMPIVVPLLVGNVLFPRLLPWEVKGAHETTKTSIEALKTNPDAMVKEMLHRAAYYNNTLGRSPFASAQSMSYFTPETIRNFMLDHFAPERMVLVGVNVNIADLSKWAMRSFVDYNAIPLKERDASEAAYTGGDLRLDGPSTFCHLAVGLEAKGANRADLAVLQAHLGDGAFSTSYSDSGLIGLRRSAAGTAGATLANDVATALKGLASLTEAEVARARALAKGNLFRSMDDDATLMNDIAQQLITTGQYCEPSVFATQIDGVTVESATAAASNVLSSTPTVAAYGDNHALPHYDVFKSNLA